MSSRCALTTLAGIAAWARDIHWNTGGMASITVRVCADEALAIAATCEHEAARLAQAETELAHWRACAAGHGETDGHGWSLTTDAFHKRAEQAEAALATATTDCARTKDTLERLRDSALDQRDRAEAALLVAREENARLAYELHLSRANMKAKADEAYMLRGENVKLLHDLTLLREADADAVNRARQDAVRQLLGDVTTEDLTRYFLGRGLMPAPDWRKRLAGLQDRLLAARRNLDREPPAEEGKEPAQ